MTFSEVHVQPNPYGTIGGLAIVSFIFTESKYKNCQDHQNRRHSDDMDDVTKDMANIIQHGDHVFCSMLDDITKDMVTMLDDITKDMVTMLDDITKDMATMLVYNNKVQRRRPDIFSFVHQRGVNDLLFSLWSTLITVFLATCSKFEFKTLFV